MGEEVSWRAISRGMPVYDGAGERLGRVSRLLGAPDRDIFDGVAYRARLFAAEHRVPLDGILRITAGGIYVGGEGEAGLNGR